MKQTKIVCSISDRRCEVEFLKKLFFAGMNVVRMNTAHATPDGIRVLPLHPHHGAGDIKAPAPGSDIRLLGPREPAGGLRIPVFLRHPDLLQPDPQIQGGDTLEEQLSA